MIIYIWLQKRSKRASRARVLPLCNSYKGIFVLKLTGILYFVNANPLTTLSLSF